jgi:CHAT domain-containing protein
MLCLTPNAHANKRQLPPTMLHDVMSIAESVTSSKGTVYEAKIDRGEADGIVLGWKGRAYSASNPSAKPPRQFEEIGTATVIQVGKTDATVRVNVTTKGETFRAGDIVEVRARVPEQKPLTLLWRLAALHITFSDNFKKPLNSYRTYLDKTVEPDAALMDKLLTAQHEVVEFVVNTDMDAPRKTGRYAGRKASEILQNVTPDDINTFLKFVLSYPGKYIGREWKISETFATWIINDAPPGEEEIADKLIAARTTAERAAIFQGQKALILKENWFNVWQSRAQKFSDARRFADAHALINAGLEGCDLLQRPKMKAWFWFARGYTLSDEQKYKESLEAYRQAIASFRTQSEADALKGQAFCINNSAFVLSQLGRPKDALAAYQQALILKQKLTKDSQSGNALHGMGESEYALGRYAEALNHFEQAAAERKKLNDTRQYCHSLRWKATVLSKLGRMQQAADTYTGILKLLRGENDRAGQAETWITLGDHWWRNGRYPDALAAYRDAARLREELGDKRGLAAALNGVGRLCFNQGDLAGSQEAHARALALCRETDDKAGQARALKEIADLLHQRGETPQALERYGESLAVYRALGNRIGEADVTDQMAWVMSGQKRYAEAMELYRQAAALYRAADAKDGLARSLYNQGICSQNLTDDTAALALYEQAFALRQEMGAKADAAETEAEIAALIWRKQGVAKALTRLNHARSLAEQSQSPALLARIWNRIGSFEAWQFRADAARTAYTKALTLSRDPKVKDKKLEAQQLTALADLHSGRGEYGQALAQYRQAAALSEAAQNRAEFVGALRGMGWVYRSLGDAAQALACQQKALNLATASQDEFAQAEALYALAALSSDFGDTKQAFAYSERARTLYAKLKHDFGLMMADNAEGVYLYRQGDNDGARERITRSIAAAEKLNAKSDLATALENLGELQALSKQFTQSASTLKRALKLAQELGDPTRTGSVRVTLGKTHREHGQDLLKQGKTAPARQAFLHAEAEFKAALPSVKTPEQRTSRAYLLREWGRLHTAQKQFSQAAQSLNDALAIGEKIGDKHFLWEAYQAQSLLLQAQGKLPAAINALRKSVAIVEVLQQGVAGGETGLEKFQNSKVSLYERMAELLGRLAESETDPVKRKNLANDALQFVGRARFQALNQNAVKAQNTGDQALDAAADGYRNALQKQGQLEREKTDAAKSGNVAKSDMVDSIMAKNEEELTRRYVQVAQADPDFAARLKFDPRALTESAASLPDKVRLLVCFPGQDDLHLWVFDNKGIRVWHREKVARKDMYALVGQFRAGIEDIKARVMRREQIGTGFGNQAESEAKNPAWYRDNIRGLRQALTRLHSHLIAPVAKELDDAETLLVLPYGQLCYLPFETLAQENGQKTAFLGQKTRIAYLTSENHLQNVLRSLEQTADNSQKANDCYVAFADPRGRLGSALEEAQEIAALFPASEIHSKQSGNAAKEGVYTLRPDCTILHFATHGWLNSVDPNQTFLELGIPPAGPQKIEIDADGTKVTCESDGALTQLEIYPRLRRIVKSFRTRKLRLVTLSACETALAQGAPEAEVLGMPDAFALAGAASVLASQWSVETYSTTDLMVAFYEKFIKDKQSRADALFHARQTLTADPDGRYAHPFYWAAFVLYGDWR